MANHSGKKVLNILTEIANVVNLILIVINLPKDTEDTFNRLKDAFKN